jgi:hypothetical protein
VNDEKSEIRTSRQTRSVLECDSPLPLFERDPASSPKQNARRLAHSKTRWTFGALCLLTAGLCLPAAAQFSIDWHTIDGGGGTSTGGIYSVSVTIGQPDAGALLSGGNYTLQGGFWCIQAVQTPGAPLLFIARTTTNTVAVFWPLPSTGFVLQQNTNSIASVNWSNIVTSPVDDGTTRTVVVDPPTGNRFYRLFKP